MLSPRELHTNVLYAEAVTSISWRVFVLSSSIYQEAPDPQVAAFEYLSAAWSDLVQNGYLAQYDCGSGVLWAFELPRTCSKQAGTSDTAKILDMLSQRVLRQVDRGTLQASDLEHAQRRPLQSATPTARSGIDNSLSPRSYILDSNGARQQGEESSFIKFGRYDVYNAFTNALLDTLSYKLTIQHRAMPLCFNLLLFNIDVSFTAKTSPLGSADGMDTSRSTLSEHPVHIGADWLPDGRVICAVWRSSIVYRSISTRSIQEGILTTGEAILAPFGLKVPVNKLQNVSFEKPSHSRRNRLERDAIFEVLLQRGIQLDNPHEWMSCDLRDEMINARTNESTRSLLWPTELIFVIGSPAANMTETVWTDPKLILDPFSVAFDLQDLRVPDCMDEDDDLQTPRLDKLSLPVDLYADMLSDMLGPNLTSGVYPTPPELTRLQGSLHREKIEFSAPTPATTTSGFGNGLEDVGMSPEQAREGFFDNMDADDLFGDLEMDLHNDPLKEDEFGFFDTTQKVSETHKQLGDVVAAAELAVDLAEKPRHSKDKTVKFEPQPLKDETFEHSANYQAPILNVDMLNAADGVKSIEYPAKHLQPNPERSIQDRRMDEKYKSGGLFNVSPTDLPAMHDARTQPPSRLAIPLITVTEGHVLTDTSSSASSIDDSDSDSDSDSTSASNKDDGASDGSMEGVVGTRNHESKTGAISAKNENFSLLDLVSHRRPISTANLELNIDNFRRLSASLDLDGKQYMDLAHLVAYQICHWPASADSQRSVNADRKSMQSSKGGQEAGFSRSYGFAEIPPLPVANSRRRNTCLQFLMLNSSISEQVHLTLSESFSHIGRSSLHACVEFEPGQAMTNSHNDLAQSPGMWERNSTISPEEQIAQLRTATVVLCREDTKVVMSAAALSLWVELGLGPVGEPKRISAYCFAPNTDVWTHGASAFLQTMGEVFSLLKLGEHLPGLNINPESSTSGIVAVETSDSLQTYLQNLCRSLNGFGHRLVQQERFQRTVMIYIACPCEDTSAIPFFCAAFQRLNRLVLSKHRSRRWNLQLRVLPGSLFVRNFAFSPISMAVARNLGREVFDLCHQTEVSSNQNESLASLARPLPGKVGFQLQPNSSRRPLDTHLITHVSYSWKPGNPWVSFAFCDDVGGRRWHNSYYLPWEASNGLPQNQGQGQGQGQAQPGTPTTPSASSSGHGAANMWRRFVNIARDVLKSLAEISEDLMQSQLHTHYVFLARDGSIAREEMRVWRSLMEQTAKPNGVVNILGAHNSGNGGGSAAATNSTATFSAVLMNWTIAVLDCDCPLELCQPGSDPDDRDHPPGSQHPSGADPTRQWAPDLPASTPGTPSLASPGLASAGLAGSFPRDPEDRHTRLVTSDSLAWFLPARSIVAHGPSGRLELLPTWTLPAAAGAAGPLGAARAAVISGGGYLLMPDTDATASGNASAAGGMRGSGELSGERMPKVLSLRIMAAKGPSLMDLRQLAEAYRGLATMADILGLGATLPWHVSMARRSRIGLGECM